MVDGGADHLQSASVTEQNVVGLLGTSLPIALAAQTAREYAEQCRKALAALPAGDSSAAVKLATARVLATARFAGAFDTADTEAQEVEQITAMAERLDDDLARAYALVAWGFTHSAPEHTDARVRAAHQILATAARHDDNVLVPAAYVLLLVGLLEQGEIRRLDIALLDQRTSTAPHSGDQHANPGRWFHCLRSILDGNTDLAEQQAESLYAESPRTGTEALALYTTHIGMIRWMQGRIDGAEEGFLAARREYPEQVLWAASLAWLWLLQGRRTSGEALLRSLPDLDEIPRDRYWLSTVTVLAEIGRITGSRQHIERLRLALLPYAARLVPVGVGVAFWGTAARTLGLLEEHLGLLHEARAHLELAVEMSSRIGALAWYTEAQIELAEFAIRHDLTDVPSYELLAEAKATSEARGFSMLARRAMHRPRVRVLGGFEVTSLCGTRAEWTSRKARELLKMLIAARGVATSREVYMDALWEGESPARLGNRFSVAVNVIRRALDPGRLMPTQHHVVTEGDSIRLEMGHLDIDVERFLALACRGDEASRRAARQLYRGDVFSDEPYADWATTIRDHAIHVRATLD